MAATKKAKSKPKPKPQVEITVERMVIIPCTNTESPSSKERIKAVRSGDGQVRVTVQSYYSGGYSTRNNTWRDCDETKLVSIEHLKQAIEALERNE